MTDASTSNDTLTTVLIVICVIFFLVAVVFVVLFLKLWFRLQRRKLKLTYNTDKDDSFEMSGRTKKHTVFHKTPATIS